MNKIIEVIPVLSAVESAQVRDEIQALKHIWDEERHRLGAGISYYHPRVLYYATSKQMNPILRKHFDWMYEKLLKAFTKHFGVPTTFRDDLAVPGFNIYCGPTDFSTIRYNTHIDLQFLELNWEPKGSVDFATTMSFTLPIASPKNGAGLNIWNITQNDIPEEELDDSELLDVKNALYQRYEVGVATIHDGRHYHQMTVAENWLPTDERITLQGHGLIQNGTLVIYG
ncbi:hypothetical protein BH10CYA1_BH10CYA1_55290 [soil metagenome]